MDALKSWVRNWALKHLLAAPIVSDVISASKNGIVSRNGKPLTSDELSVLQSEVRFFKDMQLAKLLLGTPAEYAKRMMFEKATSYDDMVAGKMLLYALDIQLKVVNIIESGKPL